MLTKVQAMWLLWKMTPPPNKEVQHLEPAAKNVATLTTLQKYAVLIHKTPNYKSNNSTKMSQVKMTW